MRERGFAGGNVAISHCDNHAVAQALKEGILNAWEDSRIEILPTRGLCSYYAKRGGLIVGFYLVDCRASLIMKMRFR